MTLHYVIQPSRKRGIRAPQNPGEPPLQTRPSYLPTDGKDVLAKFVTLTLSRRERGQDGAASTGAIAFNDGPGGLEQQFEVSPERPLGYVLQVEAYHVVKGGAAA